MTDRNEETFTASCPVADKLACVGYSFRVSAAPRSNAPRLGMGIPDPLRVYWVSGCS
jgi:hypothetical protein